MPHKEVEKNEYPGKNEELSSVQLCDSCLTKEVTIYMSLEDEQIFVKPDDTGGTKFSSVKMLNML